MARQVRKGGAATSSSRISGGSFDSIFVGPPEPAAGGGGVPPSAPTPAPYPRARHQVREQAVGSRHASGQLAEEGQARVDERALAVPGGQEGAGQRLLAGIVHGQHRLVLRIPLAGEVQAALLNPAREV